MLKGKTGFLSMRSFGQCAGNEGKYNFDLDDWTHPDKIVFELGVPKCPASLCPVCLHIVSPFGCGLSEEKVEKASYNTIQLRKHCDNIERYQGFRISNCNAFYVP